MFFVISKIVGFLINAYNLVFFSILLYFFLSKSNFKLLRFLSNFFALIAITIIIIGGFKAIPNYFIWNFENIIQNGLTYGDKVFVNIEKGNKRVLILIDDDGHGIHEEQYKNVFKHFFRFYNLNIF